MNITITDNTDEIFEALREKTTEAVSQFITEQLLIMNQESEQDNER